MNEPKLDPYQPQPLQGPALASKLESNALDTSANCGTGVALDDRPDQKTFPVKLHGLTIANPTTLDSAYLPYSGPERVEELAHLLEDLRAGIPLKNSYDVDTAIHDHFGRLAKDLFTRPHEQRAVLLDGVYLVARASSYSDSDTFIVDLVRHSDKLTPIFNILRTWGNNSVSDFRDGISDIAGKVQLELRYVAGFHDGRTTHATSHSVPCSLVNMRAQGAQLPNAPRAWEHALAPEDAPWSGTSLAELRSYEALGQLRYTFPEEVLAYKASVDLVVPSPHLQVRPFTPPVSPEVPPLSKWTREKPNEAWHASLQAAAHDVISEANAREKSFCKTAEGKDFLQRMGETFRDSPYLPQKPSRAINIWSDPYREAFANALTQGYINISYLTHPSMLEGHLHASKQPFIPCNYKHIPALSEALKSNRGVSYNEFGSWAKGYAGDALVNESTTAALPNLWAQSFKGVPALAGIVGSSMNWMAGAQGYAAAALSGFPVFIAADGLQKEREIQAKLYERTVELIRNHPLVTHYPWPDHRLSNGELAREYLVRTAISRIGITVKPFPTEDAKATVAYFLDKYGIQNYRLYDPGITSLLIKGSDAISDTICQHYSQLMQHGPLASDVGYIAGQVSNMTQAQILSEYEHIRGLIVGITEGGHCETGIKHGLYANNQLVLYQLARMGLPFPILADGGPGIEGLPNVLLCGGSGVLVSGTLFGGVLEHPPFNNWFVDTDGRLLKFTWGEASRATKYDGGETYGSGAIKNEEGNISFKFDNSVRPTLGHKALDAVSVIAKTLRWERGENIEQIRLLPEPRIVWGTADADKARRPHNQERPMRPFGHP